MRDYFPRREFRDKGFSELAIRALEKISLVAEAIANLEAQAGQIDNLDDATDALGELIEDAELTLATLDARLDDQESGNGPYVKKTGDTMSGNLNVNAEVECDTLRINTAPSVAAAVASTHKVAVNLNGTTYYLLASNV